MMKVAFLFVSLVASMSLLGDAFSVSVANTVPATRSKDEKYWEIGGTLFRPQATPIPDELRNALYTNTHPVETQEELGRGVFVTADWRKAWHNYESPPEDPSLIDPETGFAEYDVTDIEGILPQDLVGTLYRNGPGKFGVNGERVQHVLDADALVIRVTFPPPSTKERRVQFRSKFVWTEALEKETEANQFLYRGTFGTSPRGWTPIFGDVSRKGLNEDPSPPGNPISRMAGNAFQTNIKNTANTQVIAFGGKLLALFEAGLPHALDPETLDTLGEDDMGGTLRKGRLPVKIAGDVPEMFVPDFLGGAAHTAHPNVCPRTGHLIGWHWSQLVSSSSLEVTFNEWSPKNFELVASKTFEVKNCDLAPHDMAITENCVMLKVNALTMNQGEFISGLKGPAASLAMDGRASVYAHIFPRPTAAKQFEPFQVELPACFSIHFSHAYEDEVTGNIVSFFSGWPASDSKDFLGAWGGFAPDFTQISKTLLWRLEVDPNTRTCVSMNVAPGSSNACVEHPLVHPNFQTRPAKNVYASASNLVGDSSAPCGFTKHQVEDGNTETLLDGEKNTEIDAYFFGTRYFAGEPLIVPKHNGNLENENQAYLVGMVQDSVLHRSGVSIFDLERDLKEGPVCVLWFKSSIPHGLHGCFALNGDSSTSVFC